MERNLENVKSSLHNLLQKLKITECHGLTHAKKVLKNAEKALAYYNISQQEQTAVLLASLLHDADDRKFFPNNKNYENTKQILKQCNIDKAIEENVIFMIDLVSSSKNGDTIPETAKSKEWLLIPRYADRLEALGIEGIRRCTLYNKVINLPFFLDSTPRPRNQQEIWKHATKERYEAYNGVSASMLDHYYDKLLRLSKFPIKNPFFDKESELRRKPLISFVLHFSKYTKISYNDIEDFLKKWED